jgi:hypothetical protein
MLNQVTFCADPKKVETKDFLAIRLANLAKEGKLNEVEGDLKFPYYTYTQTEAWTGKVTTFTTRARWVDKHYWNESDIVYYEKMVALQQAALDEELIDQVIVESEGCQTT